MPPSSAAACMAFTLSAQTTFPEASFLQGFTTNAICRPWNCINPVFPGVEDLRLMEASQLQCQSISDAKQHMQFCKNAVNYDVAIPSPNKSAATLESTVLRQDNAASTAYYYHLAGMNVDGWEHKNPDQSDDMCTKAIWKMVCGTYFPRAEVGCKKGEPTRYLRPCGNVCSNYIKACNVECCDESVQCVFSKKVSLLDGSIVTTSGYHSSSGPSVECTGSSARQSPGLAVLLTALLTMLHFSFPAAQSPAAKSQQHSRSHSLLSWARLKQLAMCVALIACCTGLQGCMLGQLYSHPTPTWEQKVSYWDKFQFVPQGVPATHRVHNSCSLSIPKQEQCSGHGECMPWRPDLKVNLGGESMKFCRCYRDWADPECRTKRKSQMVAYFLSLFLGIFGADLFYLGFYYAGFAKLATLGGAGVWWIIDIVRIGSSPIYASDYRLAYDLPHWLYVIVTVGIFMGIGYFLTGFLLRARNFQQAKQKYLMKEESERCKHLASQDSLGHEHKVKPSFSSYPIPMLPHQCYGSVPPEIKQSGTTNPFSPWAIYNNATSAYKAYTNGGGNLYDSWGRPKYPQDFAMKASCAIRQDSTPQQFYSY